MDIAAEFLSLETAVLSPEVRRDPARLTALLAEDFQEFGSSGCTYTRSAIVAALTTEDSLPTTLQQFACTLLSPAIALVTYRSRRGTSEALRSSVWVQREGRWQMLFHQGTPIPASTP